MATPRSHCRGRPREAGGAPLTGYNMYEGTAPGHELSTPINGVDAARQHGDVVTGLANGNRYYFEVTAVNPAGEGAPSSEAAARPGRSPGAPDRGFGHGWR